MLSGTNYKSEELFCYDTHFYRVHVWLGLHDDTNTACTLNATTTTALDQKISATHYAQTWYPFLPFIERFTSDDVKKKQVAEFLVLHHKHDYQAETKIANVRKYTAKCNNHEYDFLIFVKNADSFCALFTQHSWLQLIDDQRFALLTLPLSPAQLAVIVRNVDLRLNLTDLKNDLKINHKNIGNVMRLKSKYQNDIKTLKIEFLSSAVRDHLLSKKDRMGSDMFFHIDDYIGPADVLISNARNALASAIANINAKNRMKHAKPVEVLVSISDKMYVPMCRNAFIATQNTRQTHSVVPSSETFG